MGMNCKPEQSSQECKGNAEEREDFLAGTQLRGPSRAVPGVWLVWETHLCGRLRQETCSELEVNLGKIGSITSAAQHDPSQTNKENQ